MNLTTTLCVTTMKRRHRMMPEQRKLLEYGMEVEKGQVTITVCILGLFQRFSVRFTSLCNDTPV